MKMKVSEIKNNPNNPRLIKDDKFDKLVQSIKDFPEMLDAREIVVNKDHIILGGNMRFKAAKAAGLKELPVKIVDWSEDKQREFIIKDNVSGGEWDWDSLANEWDAEELDAWGLDLPESLEPEVEIEEDEAPEVSSEPAVSELGRVYELGRHRLYCGDSTISTSYDNLLAGSVADMVFTDPPYGMKKEADGVLNDNLNFDKLLEFNQEWIPLTLSYTKANGSWYCWGIDEPLMDIYAFILKPYIKKNELTFRNLITWDKTSRQGQMSELTRMYATADEKCLFVMKGKQTTAQNKDEFPEEWRPLLDYFLGERKKMGWNTKDVQQITGKSSASHYFTESQFAVPTEEHYKKIQEAAAGQAFLQPFETFKKRASDALSGFYSSRAYFNNTHDNMNNVWHFDRTSQQEREGTGEHATPKPLALCARAIKTSSEEKEIVLDVFGGSGSTLIACEQTNRTCYMMELDPRYVDVIRKRYHKFVTGSEEGWEDGTQAI